MRVGPQAGFANVLMTQTLRRRKAVVCRGSGPSGRVTLPDGRQHGSGAQCGGGGASGGGTSGTRSHGGDEGGDGGDLPRATPPGSRKRALPQDAYEATERAGLMSKARLSLPTLAQPACVGLVSDALLSVTGVHTATVKLETRTADVEFDCNLTDVSTLIAAVRQADYTASVMLGEDSLAP